MNASKLLKAAKVRLRVDELRAAHRERHEITVDDLVAELEEAREIAKKAESAAPMVAASMGKAKLLGLVVEKNEVTGKDGSKLIDVQPSSRDLAAPSWISFGMPSWLMRKPEPEATVDDEPVGTNTDYEEAPSVYTFNPTTAAFPAAPQSAGSIGRASIWWWPLRRNSSALTAFRSLSVKALLIGPVGMPMRN